jgi:hypothetical protein
MAPKSPIGSTCNPKKPPHCASAAFTRHIALVRHLHGTLRWCGIYTAHCACAAFTLHIALVRHLHGTLRLCGIYTAHCACAAFTRHIALVRHLHGTLRLCGIYTAQKWNRSTSDLDRLQSMVDGEHLKTRLDVLEPGCARTLAILVRTLRLFI